MEGVNLCVCVSVCPSVSPYLVTVAALNIELQDGALPLHFAVNVRDHACCGTLLPACARDGTKVGNMLSAPAATWLLKSETYW